MHPATRGQGDPAASPTFDPGGKPCILLPPQILIIRDIFETSTQVFWPAYNFCPFRLISCPRKPKMRGQQFFGGKVFPPNFKNVSGSM